MHNFTVDFLKRRWNSNWENCVDIGAGPWWRHTEASLKELGITNYIPLDTTYETRGALTYKLTSSGIKTNFKTFLQHKFQQFALIVAENPCHLILPIIHIISTYKIPCCLKLCDCFRLFDIVGYENKKQLLLQIIAAKGWKVDIESNGYTDCLMILP